MKHSEPIAPLVIDCSHEACRFSAVARVWTETGWANLCKAHYELTWPTKRVSNNPTVVAIREAYMSRRGALKKVRELREPGADDEPDEYALLMEELERRAQP